MRLRRRFERRAQLELFPDRSRQGAPAPLRRRYFPYPWDSGQIAPHGPCRRNTQRRHSDSHRGRNDPCVHESGSRPGSAGGPHMLCAGRMPCHRTDDTLGWRHGLGSSAAHCGWIARYGSDRDLDCLGCALGGVPQGGLRRDAGPRRSHGYLLWATRRDHRS